MKGKLIIILLGLTSCINQDKNISTFNESSDQNITDTAEIKLNHETVFLNNSPVDSLSLYGNHICFDSETSILYISKASEVYIADTISFDFFRIGQRDLNMDGSYDIWLELADADATIEYWYTFNSKNGLFERVRGMQWFVNPERLTSDTTLYFTKAPNGCAGNIWSSTLLTISESNVIVKGKINFDGCMENYEQDCGTSILFEHYHKGNRIVIQESVQLHEKFLNGNITLQHYWRDNLDKYN